MSEEIKPNVTEAPTQDAQLAAENMATGVEKAPKIDLDTDYQAAQQFSVSEIDRTGEGAAAAEAATAPKFKVPEAKEVKVGTAPAPTGNPDDYMAMAADANVPNEGVTTVSDELLEKAFEKGEAG